MLRRLHEGWSEWVAEEAAHGCTPPGLLNSGAHTGLKGAAHKVSHWLPLLLFWVESLLKKLTWTCDRGKLLTLGWF